MSSAIKFPGEICENNVTNCDQAIQCDLCDSCVYIKCNDLNYIDCKLLQNSNDPWFCISCCMEIFRFNTVKIKTLSPISIIVTANLKTLMTKTSLYY